MSESMNKMVLLLILVAAIIILFVFVTRTQRPLEKIEYAQFTLQDIPAIFPQTPHQVDQLARETLEQAKKAIAYIIAIPDEQRTFANTVAAFDNAASYDFAIPVHMFSILKEVTNDAALRDSLREKTIEMSNEAIDLFSENIQLYKAIKAYYNGNAKKEQLTKEQRYYLDELIKGFVRAGLDKPDEIRSKIKTLKKELAALSIEFDKNVNGYNKTIEVTREELAGMDDRFINSLPKSASGKFMLNTSYPVLFPIFEYCTVANTREKLWRLNANKAYPENQEILDTIIKKRDELAKLLGYTSYAQYDIDDEMAQNPERVEQFLKELIARTNKKEREEHDLLKTDLPESVTLSSDDKFYPWDRAHTMAMYKKKHFNIDQREIANYFPMQSTVKGLLDIYHAFFGINFKELPLSGVWDPDVTLIEVTSQENNELLGYLLLDLYPRPNKYGHACQSTIIPAVQKPDGTRQPALVLVIANFPKALGDEPSLLELNEVNTFFHEFGHALHAILGATQLAGTSGTRVKTDFVELPSQMLEEWLWDAAILKQLSKHYQTGQPLSDELIKTIIEQKNFSTGSYIQRQVYLAFISLLVFQENGVADTQKLTRMLSDKIRIHSIFDNDDHFEVSFGHLMGYGAKYYSYLWSKVFALDLFYYIKERGLLNSEVGKKYVQKILMPGGSIDPNKLLRDFLGREPNSDAFFKDLGF